MGSGLGLEWKAVWVMGRMWWVELGWTVRFMGYYVVLIGGVVLLDCYGFGL